MLVEREIIEKKWWRKLRIFGKMEKIFTMDKSK